MGYRSDWKIVFNTYKKSDHVLNTLKDFVTNNPEHEVSSLLDEMLQEAVTSHCESELELSDEGWKLYSWELLDGVLHDLFDEDPEIDFASVRLGEESDDNDVRCGDNTYLYVCRFIGDTDLSPMQQFIPPVQDQSVDSVTPKEEACGCGKMKDIGTACWWCGG